MTTTFADRAHAVYELGIQLPEDERESVALRLLDSLEPEEDNPELVKKAWQAELQRRVEAVKSGTVKTYSLEETMAYLRQVVCESEGQ